MDFIRGDEKIMDLTKGYLDHADGQWFIDHYNRCDKPSFYDLVASDFSLAQNVEEED
jgi:hypothetical protein